MHVDTISQCDDTLWTSTHSEHTSFTAVGIHHNSTFQFSHFFSICLWIIVILMIKTHAIVEHPFRLYGRTLWVKLYRLDIAVNRFLPVTLFPPGIALFVVLPGGSKFQTLDFQLSTIYNTLSYQRQGYSSSTNRSSWVLLHQEQV